MAFAIRMAGTDISKMSDTEILEALNVASYPDDEEYGGEILHLTLQSFVVSGKQDYQIKGFQTLEMVVDENTGEASGYLTKGKNGNPAATLDVDFTASRFGVHTASIPYTPSNARVVAGELASKNPRFILSKKQEVKDVEKGILELAKEIATRVAYAEEYAAKTVVDKIHEEFASIVMGLKETFGDGFNKCSEYKKEIQPKIDSELSPIKVGALRSTGTLKELKEKFPMPKSDAELKKEAAKAKAAKAAKAKKDKEDKGEEVKEATKPAIPTPPTPPKPSK